MNEDMNKLQNGSDIRGVALEGVSKEHVTLGAAESYAIGVSFAKWLSKLYDKDCSLLTISVGHDPRISAETLMHSMIKGLCSQNIRVLDAGLSSTPAMFMSTVFKSFNCDGAIMITASHLPYNRNGFKFFSKNGGLNKSDIKYILDHVKDGDYDADQECRLTSIKLLDVYSDYLKGLIVVDNPTPLKGLHIVVDAGNGSGGFFAKNVLEPLGADISGSQFLEPDGKFPNHQPNPENKDAMKSISDKVKEVNADLGLIFDTDVDRSAAVNSNGEEISRNSIVALAAALGKDKHPGGTVVTDSVTSTELKNFLELSLGLNHLRYKRGYRNVINKGMEIPDCFLAIETSGHAAYRENHFLDDGAYLAVKIVIEAAKLKAQGLGIETLIEDLKQPLESSEYRVLIDSDDFSEIGDNVILDLTKFAEETEGFSLEEPNYEGVRINFNGGWLMVRKSLHDPVIPINIESSKEGGVEFAKKHLKELLIKYPELDISVLD
ncbi:MAG: phosphomannomutase/phosphoglucomutase [Peptostreptococcaceae bacterium]|nr:phosphomannomutase/phosphoglucomutase [Peptostreptococcaceae bacterium]